MKTIVFDKNSYKWDKDCELNSLILRQIFNWLKDLFSCRGYVYLNQICEHLGINWNPNDENICYKKENGPIEFDYELTAFNEYRILITQ